MQIALSVKDLTKQFGDFTAVNNLTFDVEDGKFFSILGPSGCGKTTLLRMIAGFYQPTKGSLAKICWGLNQTNALSILFFSTWHCFL